MGDREDDVKESDQKPSSGYPDLEGLTSIIHLSECAVKVSIFK